MQISIEKEKCICCGLCGQRCPDVFKLGDDGKSQVLKADCCGTCCGCNLSEIAKGCPGNAISVK